MQPTHIDSTHKVCGRCQEKKPLEDFAKAPGHKAGLYRKDNCKACHKEKRREDDEKARLWLRRQQEVAQMALEAEAKLVAEKRVEIIEDKTRELLEKHMPRKRERIEAPHVTEALEAVLREMNRQLGVGGETAIQTYGRVLVECFADAMVENKAGVATQRYHGLLQQMIKASTEHRRSAPDVTEFFDEAEIWKTVGEKALDAMSPEMLASQLHRIDDEALIAEYHRRHLHLTVINEPT